MGLLQCFELALTLIVLTNFDGTRTCAGEQQIPSFPDGTNPSRAAI
jgi:hypothetical protein